MKNFCVNGFCKAIVKAAKAVINSIATVWSAEASLIDKASKKNAVFTHTRPPVAEAKPRQMSGAEAAARQGMLPG